MADRRESQGAEQRCECGGVQRITPTFSPWEFNYRCEGCGRAGTISWAHSAPAPVFVPDGTAKQGELF